MPRRVTPEIPLTPEQLEAQEIRQALFDQTMQERAFLCYLLKRPAEMESFIGNPTLNEYFVHAQHCCIYECMEKVFLEQGAVDPLAFLRLVAEELVERYRYEWVGGPEYLAHLESRVSFAPQFVWEFRQ